MSDDVLITPASRKIEFKDNSGNVDGKIELDSSGNLKITSPGGGLELGDAASDIYVGNGSANIDIIFEQNGEIRGTTGRTVTLGQSDSNIAVNALNFTSGGNEVMTSATLFPSGTTNTGLPTAGALNIANPPENDNHVFHPYLNNDLGHFVERGGSYAWAGLSSNPSADSTKTMFNANADFCSINDSTISGSTYTLTLTSLPKGLSYSAYVGVVFCHDTFSSGSIIIETSTDGGSNWTTRLTDSSSKTVYACTFDSGGTATNALRFTFSAAPGSAQTRIQSIAAYNYNSAGMENYFLPLKGGTVYGEIIASSGVSIQNADTTLTRNGAGSIQIEGHTVLTDANVSIASTTTNSSDADHVLINDGGFLKKITPANLGIGSGGGGAADDITAGDAAVNLTTTSGNITIDAQGNDTDIIFKGTDSDGSGDITALTLDMSEAGAALFNDVIRLGTNKPIEFVDSQESIRGDGFRMHFKVKGNDVLKMQQDYIEIHGRNVSNINPGIQLYNNDTNINNDDEVGTISGYAYTSLGIIQYTYNIIEFVAEQVSHSDLRGAIEFKVNEDGPTELYYKISGKEEQNIFLRDIKVDTGKNIIFEGATANDYETTVTVTDPTADRTITLPDATGEVVIKDSSSTVTLTSTDDGATASPILTLDRNSASPADDDVLGAVTFKGRNDAGETIEYASFQAKAADVTDGTEDGRLLFKIHQTDALKTVLDVRQDSFKLNNVSKVVFGDPISQFVFEGATGDAHELTLNITDPTADRTIVLPDASGTVLLNTGDQTLTGHFLPGADDTYDLGSSSAQWRDIYTGDINLNNTKTRDNEVDGTRGSWTIQEGADDLFLINRVSGKKYKFKLEEIK